MTERSEFEAAGRTVSELDGRLLADVLLLADSALPVGAFSHSFGLEAVFSSGSFRQGGDELEALLAAWLESEWAGVDGAAFALAHTAASRGDLAALERVDRRVHAMRLPAEWRRGASQIGRQLLRLAVQLADRCDGTARDPAASTLRAFAARVEAGAAPGQHCAAAGAVYAARGVPLHPALTAFLTSTVQSLVAVAVRLVPLGQVEGQILVRRLVDRALPLARRAAAARSPCDLGGFGPYFEIEGMNHEILETRLFIS